MRGFQFQDLQYSWTLGVSEAGTICAKLHHLQLPTPSSSCMAAWLMPKIHLRIPLLPSALNSRGETKECKGKARHFNGRQSLKESLEPWKLVELPQHSWLGSSYHLHKDLPKRSIREQNPYSSQITYWKLFEVEEKSLSFLCDYSLTCHWELEGARSVFQASALVTQWSVHRNLNIIVENSKNFKLKYLTE